MIELKIFGGIFVLGFAYHWLVAAVEPLFHDFANTAVLLAAAAAACVALWKMIVVPLYRAIRRSVEAIEILLRIEKTTADTDARITKIESRLEDGDRRFDELSNRL